MTTPKSKELPKKFEMDNRRDWQLFFLALVSKYNQERYIHPIDVLDASGENVTIKITQDTLALFQKEIFSSPDKLLRALPYTQQSEQNRKPKAPLPAVTEITSGLALLQQFFSKRTLEIFCIPAKGESTLWIDSNKVLIREVQKKSHDHAHLKITIIQIREALAKYSIDELRAAIAPKNHPQYRYLNDEKDAGSEHPHLNEEIIKRIIGEAPNADSNTTSIYIDYGLLLQFITAPTFKVSKEFDTHVIVTFSKSHLLAYLHTALPAPVLFNMKPGQQGKHPHELQGNIIGLGLPQSPDELSETLFRFIIDISTSMQDSLERLKVEIKRSIRNLIKNGFGESAIQLIAFNDKFIELPTNDDTRIQLSLDNQNINPCLTEFIDALKADSNTRLAKAIEKGLCKHTNPHCNTITMIFTDGEDNYVDNANGIYERDIIIPKIQRQLHVDPNVPSIITIGWGSVNTELLENISKATGCQFISLEDSLDFEPVIMQALEKTESFTVLHLLLNTAKNFQMHMMVRDNEVRASEEEFLLFKNPATPSGKQSQVRINGKNVILTPKIERQSSGSRFRLLTCCIGANNTTEEDQKKPASSTTGVELTFNK